MEVDIQNVWGAQHITTICLSGSHLGEINESTVSDLIHIIIKGFFYWLLTAKVFFKQQDKTT